MKPLAQVEEADPTALWQPEPLQARLAEVLALLEDRLWDFIGILPLVIVAALVFVAFVLFARLFGRLRWPYRWLDNPFLRDLARQAARGGTLLIGALVALEILQATALVGAVLGTAGVIGLALGFAFRDLAENYIASVMLSLRQPFAAQDHVIIDGREGKVLRLTSRATILISMDGNHVRIPNATVFKGTIVNLTRKPERRFEFTVGVGVSEDLLDVQRIGVEAMQGVDRVLAEPEPVVLVDALADSSVTLRCFGWVDQREADFGRVRSEAIRRVKDAYDRAGVEMPEPTSRVQILSAEQKAAQDREARVPEAGELDTSVEDHLDREIEAERAAVEPDLLEQDGVSEFDRA